MFRFRYHIYTGLLVMLFLLLLPYVWKLFGILFLSPSISILSQLSLYKWVGVGMVAALIVGKYYNKNLKFVETFSHESTHTVVALLFFRKVHSFHAEEDSGVVYTSGSAQIGQIPMSLAPYCLPIFTYLLLSLRSLMDFHGMWIFDIIIGVSIAFHMGCFYHQTGSYQTDINKYPLFFSYTYIYVARLINLCIILVAFFPQYNVFTSVWRLLTSLYDSVVACCSFVI